MIDAAVEVFKCFFFLRIDKVDLYHYIVNYSNGYRLVKFRFNETVKN